MTDEVAAINAAEVVAMAAARAMLSSDRVSQSLRIELLRAGPRQASLAMYVAENMLNGFGSCHGGVLFTFADTALSCACNSHNQRSVAHHCSIIYLRPANLGERLVATESTMRADSRHRLSLRSRAPRPPRVGSFPELSSR